MSNGMIGKKLGMTSIFSAKGEYIPVTIVEAGPCIVTQEKNKATDGYNAIQLGFGEKKLSKTNRCIANDHIGFGLSDKPFNWNYLPVNHARNFKKFVNHLNLNKFILVVNDWGGPIGLSYAVDNPDKIKHLIITNTWMWSAKNDPYYRKFSGFVGGPMGRFLIKHFNFFGKVIIKKCIVDNKNFNPGLYKHLETKKDRKGCWTFPKQIIDSSEWLDSIWQKRENLINIPKTLIWGMKDIAFREKEFNIWNSELSNKTVIKLDNVGHYPHEEATEVFVEELKKASSS